jgi:3-phosphoglycerate kinase
MVDSDSIALEAALTTRGLLYKLTELLGTDYPTVDITFCGDSIGSARHKSVEAARIRQGRTGRGQVLLLENVRFYREEMINSPSFGAALAQDVDFFVNDAFSVSHRAHASVVGIKSNLNMPIAVSGYHFQAEMKALEQCFSNPGRPFVCVLGGSKTSAKIACIRSLLLHADKLLIGGAMAFTFLQALGIPCGRSPVEEACVHEAKGILTLAKSRGVKIVLPCDFVCSSDESASGDECKAAVNRHTSSVIFTCKADAIPPAATGFDIGPSTSSLFRDELHDAHMVLWNGPMGKFEEEAYGEGTNKLIDYLADLTLHGVVTVACGGDTGASVERHLSPNKKARLTNSQGGHGHGNLCKDAKECFTHTSLAGGAALEFLANPRNMCGVGALSFTSEIPDSVRACHELNEGGDGKGRGEKATAAAAAGGKMLLAQPDLH